MKKYLNILTLWIAAILAVAPATAKNWDICENPDERSILPGGTDKWMANNFKYPIEAWRETRKKKGTILRNFELIIGKDGKVLDYQLPEKMHPALKREFDRVIQKMHWLPGYKDGEPVISRIRPDLIIAPENTDGENIPFGLENIVSKGKHALAKLKKMHSPTTEKDSATINALGLTAELFPTKPVYSIYFAGVCASNGINDRSISIIDSCYICYRIDPDTSLRNESNQLLWPSGYSGRYEIWISLVRIMHHILAKSDKTDRVCLEAFRYINDRIEIGDLRHDPTPWIAEQRSQRRMQDLQRERVNEFFSKSGQYISTNTPSWERMMRNYTIAEVSSSLGYWSKEGKINNAQVAQLTALLDEERKATLNGEKATSKDYARLFGCKALAIWALEGEVGLKNFINEIRSGNPTKKLASYLDNLEKNYDRYSSLLSDYPAAMLAIVSPVPPQGTDEEGQRAFYERRRAAEKVFPIKWLSSN